MHSSPSMTTNPRTSGLPDPAFEPAFYQGVLMKRALAWAVDVALLGLMTLVLGTITLVGLFFLPLIYLVLSFLYRTALLQGGGTLGMRLFGIEIRAASGHRLSGGEAALHTLAYLASMGFVLPMILSWGAMVTTARGQGLPDLLLGSAAINRPH